MQIPWESCLKTVGISDITIICIEINTKVIKLMVIEEEKWGMG
jgi:hypothetical protein